MLNRRFVSVRVLSLVAATIAALSPFALAGQKRDVHFNYQALPNAPIFVTGQRVGSNPRSLKGFAIDVKNVSNKPIYFVSFALVLEDTAGKFEGNPLAFWMDWGSPRLAGTENRATTEESLAPGKTVTLTITPQKIADFEATAADRGVTTGREFSLLPLAVGFGDETCWDAGAYRTKAEVEQLKAEVAAIEAAGKTDGTPLCICGNAFTYQQEPTCECLPTTLWALAPCHNYLQELKNVTCPYQNAGHTFYCFYKVPITCAHPGQ